MTFKRINNHNVVASETYLDNQSSNGGEHLAPLAPATPLIGKKLNAFTQGSLRQPVGFATESLWDSGTGRNVGNDKE